MRIEGGYLYCDRDEAENIVRFQQIDDEYRVVNPNTNEAPPWTRVGIHHSRDYHPVEWFVLRRRLDRCRPELLAMVHGYNPLSQHFI